MPTVERAPPALSQESMDRVTTAIRHLPPEERDVFLLRQNGGLNYEQIALLRRCPLGAVKDLMRGALRSLRAAL